MADKAMFFYVRGIVSSPAFHKLLRTPASREKLESRVRKGVIGQAASFSPLFMGLVFIPYMSSDLFGDMTRPLVWITIVGC